MADAEAAATSLIGKVDAVGAVAEQQAGNVEAAAAQALAAAYKELPGVVADLIHGETVAEVKTAFAAAKTAYGAIKASVLAEFGDAVPGAHAGTGAPPAPTDPLDMIAAGIQAGK